MAILTWRDVAGPNFSGAAQSAQLAANLFSRAGEGLVGAVGDFDKAQNAGANQQALLNMLQHGTQADYANALQTGALTAGLDPKRLSTDTINTLATRQADLQKLENINQEMDRSAYTHGRQVSQDVLSDAMKQPFNDSLITATGDKSMVNLAGLSPDSQANLASTLSELKVAGQKQQQDARKLARQEQVETGVAQVMQAANQDQARVMMAGISDPVVRNEVLNRISPTFKGVYGPEAVASPEGVGSDVVAPVGSIGSVNANSPTNYNAAVQNNPMLPQFIEGLAKLETAGGTKSIKGKNGEDSFNLFNIKDFSKNGTGFTAFDKAEGSNDRYRVYSSPEESKGDLIRLLATRYPKALQAKTPQEFATALKEGGYATDPNYVDKLTKTIGSGTVNPANVLGSPLMAPTKDNATLQQTAQAVSSGRAGEIARDLVSKVNMRVMEQDPDGLGRVWDEFKDSKDTASGVASQLVGKDGSLEGGDRPRIMRIINNAAREHKVPPALVGRILEGVTQRKNWYSSVNIGTTNMGGKLEVDDEMLSQELTKFKDKGLLRKLSAVQSTQDVAAEAAKANTTFEAQQKRVQSLAALAQTNPNYGPVLQKAQAELMEQQDKLVKLLHNSNTKLNTK